LTARAVQRPEHKGLRPLVLLAARAALWFVAWLAASPALAQKLERYGAASDAFSVSGISSGGYMAVQMAVAHSKRVDAVGVFAAGPYRCAGYSVARALGECMKGTPTAGESVREVQRLEGIALVDGSIGLKRMRAWLHAGAADPYVRESVVQAAQGFFAHFNPAGVHFESQPGLGHGLPTRSFGVACDQSAAPFLNRCGNDAAAQMLDFLLPGAATAPAPPGRLMTFDQKEFVPLWQRSWSLSSLDDKGYLFLPARCSQGTRCRVHVALHGCKQGVSQVQDQFVVHAGYNDWADTHDTIVLYPQVVASMPTWFAWWRPINPNGCWDWWGYTGPNYAVKSATQIAAIVAMVERLQSPR
jgi:poly(3-hydroxybutyrate) depolymerase